MSDLPEWAERQLAQAGYAEPGDIYRYRTRSNVLKLVQTFDDMKLDQGAPEIEQEVINLLHELLNRRALPPKVDTGRWVPARQAPPSLGSRVKIRPDAFTGDQGIALNGRECHVQAARRGEFIVGFDDGNVPISARVLPQHLLSRVS